VASTPTLEFEKPIFELERQIDELKRLAGDQQIHVDAEIAPLEKKLTELRQEVYRNLSPLQRLQVARSNKRPFSLDYIRLCLRTSSSCTVIGCTARTPPWSADGRASRVRR
jgi:acetyl-CoA carboxylase carboxyl transferase subunit alpha